MRATTVITRTTTALKLALPALCALALAGCGGSSGGGAAPPPATGGGGSGGGSGGGGTGGGGTTVPQNPVVFVAALDDPGQQNLYLADAEAAGGNIMLNPPFATPVTIQDFALSPDSSFVVYLADQDVSGEFELYQVALDTPGTAVQASAAGVTGSSVLDFQISPDSARLLYRADHDAVNVRELYLTDLATPGSATKVNPMLVANGDVGIESTFSPDGTQILYAADQQTDGLFELWLADTAVPGVASRVNAPFSPAVTLRTGAVFSPDGQWIAYGADQDTLTVSELYVVASNSPGTAIRANPAFSGDSDVCSWAFSPDSGLLAYCADQDTAGVLEIYLVDLLALGVATKLHPPLVAGGEATPGFAFSGDSSFVVYIAEQDTADVRELYRVDVATPGLADKLSAPLIAAGDVFSFEIRADDAAVAYRADQTTNGVIELHEVEVDAPGIATRVHPALSGDDVFPFRYAANGARLIYIADQGSAGATELFAVETDNLGQSLRLNDDVAAGGFVGDFRVPQ